jgi:hypothetical protein
VVYVINQSKEKRKEVDLAKRKEKEVNTPSESTAGTDGLGKFDGRPGPVCVRAVFGSYRFGDCRFTGAVIAFVFSNCAFGDLPIEVRLNGAELTSSFTNARSMISGAKPFDFKL